MFAFLITIPISMSAVLVIKNLSDELIMQEKKRLHRFEKNFLMSAFRELQKEEVHLKELLSLRPDLSKDAFTNILKKSFEQYVVHGPNLNLIHGISKSRLDNILQYKNNGVKNSIFVIEEDGENQIWMAKKFAGEIFVAVSVNPFKFLGGPDFLPQIIELCVVEITGVKVYCPHDFHDAVITETITKSRGSHTSSADWTVDDSKYIGSYWTLFLQSGFASPNWIILARVSQDYIFSPIRQFGWFFIPFIIVIIISSVLILIVQLRKNLAPLESLLEGTKRISKKDFSTHIHLEGDGEFAELAKSFNLMSSHLDRQFLSIEISAQIDETILSTFDINEVVAPLLIRIFEIFDCETSSIVLNDKEENTNRIYYCTDGQEPQIVDALGEYNFDGVRQLTWFDVNDNVSTAVDSVFNSVGHQFSGVSVPIVMERKTVGLLVLDMQIEEQDLEATEEVLNDLAQRLAVAKSVDEWEARLNYQAHHDLLTGLPNRLSFQQFLEDAVRSDEHLAVLLIDLDHFKNVNDTKGHSTGDKLLKLAAQRLQEATRSEGKVFRLGGDEFTIILNDSRAAIVERFVEDLLELVRSPFYIDGRDYVITASIGVASFPEDGRTVENLVKNADLAMYYAKQGGRNMTRVFNTKMMSETYCRTVLETDLRNAVKEKQFFLMYQPQIHVQNQDIEGLEALIRWQHPEHGVILPKVFLPVAESIGLIEEIDHCVLREVLEQFSIWTQNNVGVNRIAVNVSPTTIKTKGYIEHLQTLLAQHDSKDFLELEITENVFLENTDQTLIIIEQIKALGVNIALDDFGTGYSSMSYLHKFPIDSLKIDISFIREIFKGQDTRSIVRAIIRLANALNLTVVAEGVEHEEQVNFLDQEGCEIMQGFYYSKPIDLNKVGNYVNSFNVEIPRRMSG